MNSKLAELRAMLRREIKSILQEEDGEKTPEQIAADKELLQAKKKRAQADMKAAQTQLAQSKKI